MIEIGQTDRVKMLNIIKRDKRKREGHTQTERQIEKEVKEDEKDVKDDNNNNYDDNDRTEIVTEKESEIGQTEREY